MGWDKNLPLNVRRLLPAEHPDSIVASDRKAEQQDAKQERDMHEKFAGWLRINNCEFVHSRMDRKSTIEEGLPDFIVTPAHRPACYVEFKMPSNKTSEEQDRVISRLRANGMQVLVAFSLEQAIAWTRERIE